MRLPKLRPEKNKPLLTVHPTQRASGAKRRQTRGCWRRSASCQTPTRTGALSMSSRLLCSGAGETASRGKFLHQPPSAAAFFSALTGVLTHNFCCSPRALLAERMEGGIFDPFVYCAADHSFRSGLEGKSGDVIAAKFRFDSPDIA